MVKIDNDLEPLFRPPFDEQLDDDDDDNMSTPRRAIIIEALAEMIRHGSNITNTHAIHCLQKISILSGQSVTLENESFVLDLMKGC